MLITAAQGQFVTANLTVYWLCEEWLGDSDVGPLHSSEREVYASLRAPKRRHDWLLGRRVAKRLIQSALADHTGGVLAPDEIVILNHPDGWPQVSLLGPGEAAPPLTLSISHAGNHAFCAVAFGANVPLGADIEAVEPRSPGFVADYFTATERDLIEAAAEDRRPTLANAVWSGKEAALKAIRRGLAEDTRLVTCLPLENAVDHGWRRLEYHWEAAGRILPPLEGRWRAQDGFVMTLAADSSSASAW